MSYAFELILDLAEENRYVGNAVNDFNAASFRYKLTEIIENLCLFADSDEAVSVTIAYFTNMYKKEKTDLERFAERFPMNAACLVVLDTSLFA